MAKVKYDPAIHERAVESVPVYQSPGTLRIDKTAGVVYGVKLLSTEKTKNNRLFTRQCQEDLVPRINRCIVNLDHAVGSDDPTNFSKPKHPVTNKFARLTNARVTESGTFADAKYNKGHFFAPAFEWFVENDPEALGFSIDGILKGPFLADGTRSVESVPRLFSFDLVGDPSSTRSLFEEYSEQAATEPQEGADTPLTPPGDGPLEKLCDFVRSVMSDKSISIAERKAKVIKALDLMYEEEVDETDSDELPEDDEPETPEKPMPEAKPEKGQEAITAAEREELIRLRAENDAFRAAEALSKDTADAEALCVKADLPKQLITKVFIDTLVTRGRESWEPLIADRKLLAPKTGETPVSSERGAGVPKSTKERVDELVLNAKAGRI